MPQFPLEFSTSIILLDGVTKGSGQRLRQFVKGQAVDPNIVLKYFGSVKHSRAAVLAVAPFDKVIVDRVRHMRVATVVTWVGKSNSEYAHLVARQWIRGQALPFEAKDITTVS